MKNSPDHERLLQDALGEADEFRRASLEHTLATVKQVHRRRRLRRAVAGGAAVILAVALWLRSNVPAPVHRPEAGPRAVQTAMNEKPAIQFISEDELLAQFPGRSVALIGPPANRRLVFLDVARPR
jgi:ferric-dicitrate binding protein FerR (iron transport regulator)